MAVLTRQQLIDLINQYIYANGQQRITAVQLQEILLDIASSFAMEGGGSASGIDAVLGVGSTVTDGREITNSFGGKVQLATVLGSGKDLRKYLGINVAELGMIGQVYNSPRKTVIGNIKSSNLSNTLFDIPLPVTSTDFYTGTIYNLSKDPTVEGKLLAGAGATTLSINNEYASASSISQGNINLHVQAMTEDSSSDISLDNTQISNTVMNGPQISSHLQTQRGFNWFVDDEGIAVVGIRGLTIVQGKKLGLTSGGVNPTSGVATLVAGTVTIATAAVLSSSIISLTVQETGAFTGNIRVSAKTVNVGFTISSSINTDTCKVFWQIIDI